MTFDWFKMAALACLFMGTTGCFGEITLPKCSVVEDCPACGDWNTCEDGFCFHFGESDWDGPPCCANATEAREVADQCCPERSVGQASDPDCDGGVASLPGGSVSAPVVVGDRIAVIHRTAEGRFRALIPRDDPASVQRDKISGAGASQLDARADMPSAFGQRLVYAAPDGACDLEGCAALGVPALPPLAVNDVRYALAVTGGQIHVVQAGAAVAEIHGADLLGMASADGDLFVARLGGPIESYRVGEATGTLEPRWTNTSAGVTGELTVVSNLRLAFRTVGGVRMVFRQNGETAASAKVDGAVTGFAGTNALLAAAGPNGDLMIWGTDDLSPQSVNLGELAPKATRVLGETADGIVALGPTHLFGVARGNKGWELRWAFGDLKAAVGVVQDGNGDFWVSETGGVRKITPSYHPTTTK